MMQIDMQICRYTNIHIYLFKCTYIYIYRQIDRQIDRQRQIYISQWLVGGSFNHPDCGTFLSVNDHSPMDSVASIHLCRCYSHLCRLYTIFRSYHSSAYIILLVNSYLLFQHFCPFWVVISWLSRFSHSQKTKFFLWDMRHSHIFQNKLELNPSKHTVLNKRCAILINLYP